MDHQEYDFVIIGSGLGGLYSAALLVKEGYSVCVLEKNRQLGGCLQIFSREKLIFDTGVHYLGGLDKGQNLYRYFDYLGLMDKIAFKKLDMDGYDRISFDDDPIEYKVPQGYDNFINYYASLFPEEREGIVEFCDLMRAVCAKLPLYNVEETKDLDFMDFVMNDKPVDEVIASCVQNESLRRILAGNNPLYAGVRGVTPFYVHALVVNSYIESSYKCVKGGAQISLALSKIIRTHGGVIKNHAEVVAIETNDERATNVLLKDGTKLFAKQFISTGTSCIDA
jgi:all-trans-retinol 13,14-reductase